MVARNYQISLDTRFARNIGFTSDKFIGYLWLHPKSKKVVISAIMSQQPNRGNLRRLFKMLWAKGYCIEVPEPSPALEYICQRYGFKRKVIWDDVFKEYLIIYYKRKGED
jgi:hypothetical protein